MTDLMGFQARVVHPKSKIGSQNGNDLLLKKLFEKIIRINLHKFTLG